jgi:hypothetical protein
MLKWYSHYCQKDIWNANAIAKYQNNLANFASSIWVIQFPK